MKLAGACRKTRITLIKWTLWIMPASFSWFISFCLDSRLKNTSNRLIPYFIGDHGYTCCLFRLFTLKNTLLSFPFLPIYVRSCVHVDDLLSFSGLKRPNLKPRIREIPEFSLSVKTWWPDQRTSAQDIDIYVLFSIEIEKSTERWFRITMFPKMQLFTMFSSWHSFFKKILGGI